MADLQEDEYLFTTDVRSIAALVYVRIFLSKMVPVNAFFQGKEALQQALWRIVQAPWKGPPSTRVSHVTATPSPLGPQTYLVSR